MKILVKQIHRASALPQCATACVLALAVKEALGVDVVSVSGRVLTTKFRPLNKKQTEITFEAYAMSSEALDLACQFDRNPTAIQPDMEVDIEHLPDKHEVVIVRADN